MNDTSTAPVSVHGSSTTASPPVPVLHERAAYALRQDLIESDWGVESVAALLGPVAQAALHRELRLPAVRMVRRELEQARSRGRAACPTAVLTALFMLGEAVTRSELDAALPRTGTQGALAIGLVELSATAEGGGGADGDADLLRAVVDLRPHEAVDAAGEVRWWVASDLGELVSGRALAPDHVLGIGGAGLTLASLTVRRPVARALDLGTGCGIQTLYLLRHCEHVTATDISQRALDFTALNVALAGVLPDRVSMRRGSFLEPVSGETYDLIVTNPPFVITPPAVREAGLPLMEYRDAGGPVLPELVRGLGEIMADGATVQMLANWEHREGRPWRDDVEAWLPSDVDAWIIERDIQDPVEYAVMWLRDGGLVPERERDAFERALGAWVEDFERRGVDAVGFGYIIMSKPAPAVRTARSPWRVMEEILTTPSGPLGGHVAEMVSVRDRLAMMSDEEIGALRPVRSSDVMEERHGIPGGGDPLSIELHQGGGFARVVPVGTQAAALVGACDGDLSVAQIAAAMGVLLDLKSESVQRLREVLVQVTRDLLSVGVLTMKL